MMTRFFMIMSSNSVAECSFMGLFQELSKASSSSSRSFDHPLKWFKESNFFVKVLRGRKQFLKAHGMRPRAIGHCYETSLESLMAEVY